MAITGQFEVPVTSDTGIDFTNSQSGPVAYTFSASGTWMPDKNNPAFQGCTAEGFPSLNSAVQAYFTQNLPGFSSWTKYPGKTPYALLAENKATGEVTEVGKKATIVLKPGETLRFVLNDWSWDYGNNSGSIKVAWTGISLMPQVMQFDGDNDYITLPEMNVNYSGGFTLEAWAWYDALRKYANLIDFGNAAGKDNITVYNGKNNNNLLVAIYRADQNQYFLTPSALELGKWTHLALTIDTAENAILYKNGEQVSTGKLWLPNQINRTKNYIGGSNWGDTDDDFKGKIAEVRVWNKALTQAEIKANMSKRLTGKESGLVGYWPLNEVRVEGSALKVADLTGYFPGTVTGAVLVDDSALPVS
ncbi:MAG: LamG domain-containing protein [Oscillatoria princeps RMCB-10]|jgi:hypothetical protein|nr:LamG domain-containing protein [Oscillatoria princeps RMCB-10]